MNFCKIIQLDEFSQVLVMVGFGRTRDRKGRDVQDMDIVLTTHIGTLEVKHKEPYQDEDMLFKRFDDFNLDDAWRFYDVALDAFEAYLRGEL